MEMEVKKLEDLLDKIWRLGDRDEMSIKHIGHALASIIAEDVWWNGDDYQNPNVFFTKDGNLDLEKTGQVLAKIKPIWEEVEQIAREKGLVTFFEMVKASKFEFYPLSYLSDTWLSYNARLSEEIKAKVAELV